MTLTTWQEALRRARDAPRFTDRQRRACHELRDLTLAFDDLNAAAEPLGAIRSLGWYYPSEEELRSIILGHGDHHLYSFGKQVHENLPRIISLLKEDPDTRRALLPLTEQGAYDAHAEHLPTLVSAYFSFHDGQLHCTLHARSMDLLMGLPANLYQAAALTQEVAGALDAKSAKLTLVINSAHVFEDYDEELRAILQKP